jgi:hypothetical protein
MYKESTTNISFKWNEMTWKNACNSRDSTSNVIVIQKNIIQFFFNFNTFPEINMKRHNNILLSMFM